MAWRLFTQFTPSIYSSGWDCIIFYTLPLWIICLKNLSSKKKYSSTFHSLFALVCVLRSVLVDCRFRISSHRNFAEFQHICRQHSTAHTYLQKLLTAILFKWRVYVVNANLTAPKCSFFAVLYSLCCSRINDLIIMVDNKSCGSEGQNMCACVCCGCRHQWKSCKHLALFRTKYTTRRKKNRKRKKRKEKKIQPWNWLRMSLNSPRVCST